MYFKELVLYIHLNPLRAKIVSDIKGLNKYPYTGQSVLMGKKKHKWYDTEYVFHILAKTLRAQESVIFYILRKVLIRGGDRSLLEGV